jgi:molybdate transport system ATP-binding protein
MGEGPGALVAIDTSAGRVLSRITRRSVQALDIKPGSRLFAIIKAVAIAPVDIGR